MSRRVLRSSLTPKEARDALEEFEALKQELQRIADQPTIDLTTGM